MHLNLSAMQDIILEYNFSYSIFYLKYVQERLSAAITCYLHVFHCRAVFRKKKFRPPSEVFYIGVQVGGLCDWKQIGKGWNAAVYEASVSIRALRSEGSVHMWELNQKETDDDNKKAGPLRSQLTHLSFSHENDVEHWGENLEFF